MHQWGEASLVGDRFQLVGPVGTADSPGVWQAVDRVAGAEVAVKALRPYPVGDTVSRSRFRLVARTVLQVAGPGIAQVRDFGEAAQPDGMAVPYVVRDLVRGQTLEQRLGGAVPLAASEALRIVASVAAALAAAHQAGVPHGHVVPSNIVLGAETVTVTDFGLLALRDAPAEYAAGGGLSYAAPELAGRGPATPAADMYALGVVFVACLAGIPSRTQRPALRDGGVPASASLGDLDLDSVPAGLASMWAACMGANPAERPTAAHAAVLSWRLLGDPPASSWSAVPGPAAEPGQEPGETGAAPPGAAHQRGYPRAVPGAGTAHTAPAGPSGAGAGARPGPPRPGAAAPGVAQPGSAQSGSARLGSARLGSARLGSAQPGSERPGPRLVAFLVAAAALAAALAVSVLPLLTLWQRAAPASSPGPGRTSATAPTSTTPQPSSSATASAPATLSPRAALARISATIHADVADGQMRQDVGVDLDNLIAPVQARLVMGESAPVRQLASALRAKLVARVGEGAVTDRAARVLAGELDALARSAVH